MRTRMVKERIGENMGPVDWSHDTAKDKPQIWRDAEKNPQGFLFNGRLIYEICMYDGWPYWKPTPAISFLGPIGPDWNFFDSYGVCAESIQPIRVTEST